MALFAFQRRFIGPINAGTKRQTIRAPRKNSGAHGKVGGPITLVSGSRFKPVRLGFSTCLSVHPVVLNFALATVTQRIGGNVDDLVSRKPPELDAFAVMDGFVNWSDLCGFWAQTHPGLTLFEGIVTKWGDLTL